MSVNSVKSKEGVVDWFVRLLKKDIVITSFQLVDMNYF